MMLSPNFQRIRYLPHTPVLAGNETFKDDLIQQMLQQWFKLIPEKEFLSLGKIHETDADFGMTVFALKTSSQANGVAKLHGEIDRNMWQNLWPTLDENEIPIGHVTNGIHLKSWVSEPLQKLFRNTLGEDWHSPREILLTENKLKQISSVDLIAAHNTSAQILREEIQRRTSVELSKDAKIIGFARRFATYKRATLFLKDKERLKSILQKAPMPIVFVFSGKAHPKDLHGKQFIAELIQTSQQDFWKEHLIYLENYDMQLGRILTQGADIWMNNPRRPHEASGTSGMKAAINGVLNFSALDGWWPEAWQDERGYKIGSEKDFKDEKEHDAVDANDLYLNLENKIISDLLTENEEKRIEKMRQSIAWCLLRFNTFRMLTEYKEKYYAKGL